MKQKILIAILAIIQFTHILDFVIIMPMSETLMAYFNVEGQYFSYLVSGYPAAAVLVNLFASTFINNFDRKKVLIVAYTGFMIGTVACGVLPNINSDQLNFALFLGSRVVTGLFGGLLSALVFSIIGDLFPFERRASVMGIVMAAFSAASVLGVPVSLKLMDIYGWQFPYIMIGVLSIGVVILIIRYVPAVKDHLVSDSKKISSFALVRSNNELKRGLGFMLLVVLGQFTIIPFIVPYMINNVEFPSDKIFLIYLLGGGLTVITGPIVGRISDKIGKRRMFFIMASLSIIPFLLITNLGPVGMVVGLLVNSTLFFTSSGRMIPATTLTTALVPASDRAGYMSLQTATQSFGLLLASLISGMIVEARAGTPVENYEILGYIAVGMTLGAIFLLSRIREPNN